MGDIPTLGQFAAAKPLALFLIAAVESGVGRRPKIAVGLTERFRRRTWPIEHVSAESLQTPSVAEIEKCVFFAAKHPSLGEKRGEPPKTILSSRIAGVKRPRVNSAAAGRKAVAPLHSTFGGA